MSKTQMIAKTQETAVDGEVFQTPPVKLVKIRAKTAIAVGDLTVKPGDEVEVTEELAKEFCDKKFRGMYAFSGERVGVDLPRFDIVRAIRV